MSFTRHDQPALAARQMWFPTILPPLDNHYFNVINRRIFGFPSHKNVISMPGFQHGPLLQQPMKSRAVQECCQMACWGLDRLSVWCREWKAGENRHRY